MGLQDYLSFCGSSVTKGKTHFVKCWEGAMSESTKVEDSKLLSFYASPAQNMEIWLPLLTIEQPAYVLGLEYFYLLWCTDCGLCVGPVCFAQLSFSSGTAHDARASLVRRACPDPDPTVPLNLQVGAFRREWIYVWEETLAVQTSQLQVIFDFFFLCIFVIYYRRAKYHFYKSMKRNRNFFS